MKQENIIHFSSCKPQTQKTVFQDAKLFSFYDVFKEYFGIDLKNIRFQNYNRPSYQKRSIIGALTSTEEIDLKQNFIFNFLDQMKYYYNLYCNEELNQTRSLRADYIFLNIASELFNQKFSNRNLDNRNKQDIADTIRWLSQNDYTLKQLFIIYCAYINTDLKICNKLANLAINDPIKFWEFTYNSKLLSKKFIDTLPKEVYDQIIDTITTDSVLYPELKNEFYQYAKEICEIDPNFFSKFSSFAPFCLDNSQAIIDVFGIDGMVKMSEEELEYISNHQKNKLIEIKQLMDLGVSTVQIKKVLYYPHIIKLGYQKAVLIKNLICEKGISEREKVLSKKP